MSASGAENRRFTGGILTPYARHITKLSESMIEHKFHLPWPPSQNSIWRKGKHGIYRSQKYKDWIELAGWGIRRQNRNPEKILGAFTAKILLHPPNNRPLDIDNRVKVLLDLVERMGLIENDKYCTDLSVTLDLVDAIPVGASITLTAMRH